MIEMLVNSLMMGIVVGLRALVARFVGAGERQNAMEVARQAYVLAAVYAAVIATTGILFSTSIVKLMEPGPMSSPQERPTCASSLSDRQRWPSGS